MTKKISLLTLMIISAFTSKAATLSEKIDSFFKPIVENYLVPVIFWDPIKAMGFDVGASIPIVVVWLVFGAIYFTFRMNFINIRGFKHAISLVKGDYDDPNDKGEVSHFQSFTAAMSGTIGLGNIAGVAVAISIGGPGATLWMIITAFFGMTLKFVEVSLGHKVAECAFGNSQVVSAHVHKGISKTHREPVQEASKPKGIGVLKRHIAGHVRSLR